MISFFTKLGGRSLKIDATRMNDKISPTNTLIVPISPTNTKNNDLEKILKKRASNIYLSDREQTTLENLTLSELSITSENLKNIDFVIGVWQKSKAIISTIFLVSKDDLVFKNQKATWNNGIYLNEIINNPDCQIGDVVHGLPKDSDEPITAILD